MSLVDQEVDIIIQSLVVLEDVVIRPVADDAVVILEGLETKVFNIWDLTDVDIMISGNYTEADSDTPDAFRGIINRPFTFLKNVIGKKKTYAQVAATFSLNRTTQASGASFTSGVYGRGAYGSGVYGDKIVSFGQALRPINFLRTVAGLITSKKTAVAEISLASHVAPASRVNHSIDVRARTTSGSTGVLRVELWEGSIKRSSTLVTPPLTNVLTSYNLPIADVEAATITSYANLSLKIWGSDPTAAGLVFEIANIYLKLPSA